MTITPELAVRDRAAATATLRDVFGFSEDSDGRLRLGDQTIAVVQGSCGDHGTIDHLAIRVPDLDAAVASAIARGGVPDASVTPDGPIPIPEFWGSGVRYLFFVGPDGARIEFIEVRGAPKGPGHDHIGIPCTDIAASVDFAMSLGARHVGAYSLLRAGEVTEVRFMAIGTSVLEFYQPPAPVRRSGPGHWSRLLVPGVAARTGPDGLVVAPA